MDKLRFLDELKAMINSKEFVVVEGKDTAVRMLDDIKNIVLDSLVDEVISDITAPDTSFFAPEHEGWKAFLNYCNGNTDYATVLDLFSEAQLEELWATSHIEEILNAEEMQTQVFSALCNLKSLNLVERLPGYKPVDAERHAYIKQQQIARVKGIFNLIFEN